MKKNVLLAFALTALLICLLWLALRKSNPPSGPVVSPLQPIQTTNVQTPQTTPLPTAPTNNPAALIRPDSVDAPTWNKWMAYRQVVLEQNQPVEFYARVLDQNEQPVEGARLKLKLTRWDENEFSMSNFPHWDPAKAVQEIDFFLLSDSNGWIHLTGTNGSSLAVWGLVKDGYISSYPDGNFGGVSYEPNGRRNPSGDIQMTNSWNPQKGYIFHLQKIEGK
jgi:hypothetical protein